jgi:elongation factor G
MQFAFGCRHRLHAFADVLAIKGTDEDGNEVVRHSSDVEDPCRSCFSRLPDPFVGTHLPLLVASAGVMKPVLRSCHNSVKERRIRTDAADARQRTYQDQVCCCGDIMVGLKDTTTGDSL